MRSRARAGLRGGGAQCTPPIAGATALGRAVVRGLLTDLAVGALHHGPTPEIHRLVHRGLHRRCLSQLLPTGVRRFSATHVLPGVAHGAKDAVCSLAHTIRLDAVS